MTAGRRVAIAHARLSLIAFAYENGRHGMKSIPRRAAGRSGRLDRARKVANAMLMRDVAEARISTSVQRKCRDNRKESGGRKAGHGAPALYRRTEIIICFVGAISRLLLRLALMPTRARDSGAPTSPPEG